MKDQFIEATFTRSNSYITHIVVCLLRLGRLRLLVPGALLLCCFSHPALAEEFSKVVKPYFNYTVTADDNLLRIRDRLDPNFIPDPRIRDLISQGKLPDISNRMTGGVIFEKEISRQRLSADLSWTYTKFERFHEMNNDLKNFRGNWNWFLGNKLEGNMGASYVQSLMPFIFQPGTKTIRTEQTQFINAAWRFHPSWSLNGEYTRYDLNTDSTQQRMRFLSRTEDRFEAGIDYVTASKNTVGALFRNILGDFTSPALLSDGTPVLQSNGLPVDNGYDQKEALARINWVFSPKSRFLWTGGWVERKNNSLPERDFSGFNARMIYHWQPTDKIGLTINGWRQTGSPQNLTAGFSLNTGVSVVPSWNITQKVKLEGDFSYETRKFDRFSILTDPILAIGRHNTLRNTTLRLVYSPYHGLQLSTSIYHSDLKTDSPLGGFNANGVTANLQYVYGQR
jgi:exopolysaccharide biosynthesis operon protein EpsL